MVILRKLAIDWPHAEVRQGEHMSSHPERSIPYGPKRSRIWSPSEMASSRHVVDANSEDGGG